MLTQKQLLHSGHRLGQTTTEYVILIGIVMAALLSMQVYMKRGMQAMIKVAADQMGKQEDAEEIDPQKGTKRDSQIKTETTGTERLQVFKTGKQQLDSERISSSSGTTTFISEKEK